MSYLLVRRNSIQKLSWQWIPMDACMCSHLLKFINITFNIIFVFFLIKNIIFILHQPHDVKFINVKELYSKTELAVDSNGCMYVQSPSEIY